MSPNGLDKGSEHSLEEESRTYYIERLVSSSEQTSLCPIRYVYDYLPHSTAWLQAQQVTMPVRIIDELVNETLPHLEHARKNSIRLRIQNTTLPIHSGLASIRQSKHWQANIRSSTELLEVFVQDQRCKDAMLPDGRSMATWAQSEMASKVSECVSRFIIYMCPDADEERLCLLGQAAILIFIFDGM